MTHFLSSNQNLGHHYTHSIVSIPYSFTMVLQFLKTRLNQSEVPELFLSFWPQQFI